MTVTISFLGASLLQRVVVLWGVFLLFIVCRTIYRLFLSPLARFPGPFWARITNLRHASLIRGGNEHSALYDLHMRYGPFVRIGPNKLSTTDVATFRKIYNIAAPFPKTDYYEPFRVPTPTIDLFVAKNGTLHGKFKRQFSHVYSASGVKDLDSNIDASIEKFLAEIQKTEGTNIDLGKWFERLMLDCTCDLTFGKNQGFIDKCNIECHEDDLFAELGRLIRQAHLHGMAPLLFYAAKVSTFVTEKIFPRKNMPDVTGRAVEARLADFKDPGNAEKSEMQRSIASKLYQAQSSKGSGTFTDEDVEYLVDFGVKASVLDGSSLMNCVFYHLIHNPDKLDKLMQELDQKVNDGKLDIICTSQQAATCQYLNAVVQEAQRMFPSIGGILPRETPTGGAEIHGQHISEGVTVGAAAFAMHRMPEFFGSEPSCFLPERWLDKDQTNLSRFNMSFGLGSRTCLGKNVAWLLMRKIVPSLLLALDFEAPDPRSGWTVVSWAGVHTHDFYARVKKRASKK